MHTDAAQFGDQADLEDRDDHLRRLLARQQSPDIPPELLAAAGLPPDGELFCVVISGVARGPSCEARDAEIRFRQMGAGIRFLTLGDDFCVVADPSAVSDAQIARAVDAISVTSPDVSAGVGSRRPPRNVDRSWREAVRTHALRSMLGNARVSCASEAALLLALADMPSNWVAQAGFHGANLTTVLGPVGSRDWDSLEAYLEERSLRKAASRVYLHHTSLDARLRRLSEELGVDLTASNIQFELLLMMRVLRVETLLGNSAARELAPCAT